MEEINSRIKKECIDNQGNGILESLEFYKEFIELANFAFVVINPDKKILYCNSTAANLFGINNVELKSLTIFDLFSQIKSYTIEEESLVQNYIDGKNIKNKVVSIKRKDNSQIWINLCLKPIIIENKQIICTVLTGLDISRQIHLDQKIENSEERYRSIFNSINSGVAVYEAVNDGESFIIKDFNKNAEKIDDIKKEEIIGKNIVEFFPGIEDFGLLNVFRRVWKSGIPETHPISLYQDNRIQGWRENYVYRLETGEIVSIYNDLTEKKNQEQILKEGEEKFRLLSSYAMDAIVQIDHEGNIIYWNNAATRIFGYEFSEIKGKNLIKLITTEIDNQAFIDSFNVSKEAGEVAAIGKKLEFAGKRKDGSEIPIEISFSSVKIKSMWNAIGIIRDISVRRDYENSLNQVLNFEKLLTSISSQFIGTVDFNKAINDTLKRIGISKMVSRVYLFSFDESNEYLMNTHEWCAEDIEPHINFFNKTPLNEIPSIKENIFSGKFISIENSFDFSKDSPKLRKILSSRGVQATLAYHVYTNGKISGILGFDDEKNPRVWTPEDYSLLKVVSQIIGNALERKITEDKIKESEEKYRLISEDSDDLILAYNERMEIEYVNGETHERILGYSAHLFWKQDFLFSIIHQDDRKILGSAIREGYKGGTYKLHIRYKHEKGHYIWFEFRGKTYFDKNGSKKSLIVGRDITDIKLVQEKLQESEEKYRNILETIKEGYFEVDLNGNFTFFNDAFCEIFGYSRQELLNMNYSELSDEDTKQYLFAEYNKMFKTKKRFEFFEYPMRMKNGENVHIESSAYLRYNDKNRIIGFKGFIRDVSDRKKGEALRRSFNQKLEEEVEIRTNELAEALEKQKLYLDQIIKSSYFKSEFLGTMSHELRTPLNAIIGFTDLLLEGIYGTLNIEQLDFIKDIKSSAEHQFEMISQILDISKIESGQISLKFEDINLYDFMNNMISTLRPLINEKKLVVEMRGIKKKQLITADPLKLKHIISNLLSNAIKFTEKGYIIIEFTYSKDGWGLSVKDSGIGIAEENFGLIFKDFKRVKSPFVDSTPGSGLGLDLTKRIVELLGGRISFSSKLGEGTTFMIRMPNEPIKKEIFEVEQFLRYL